MQTPKSISDSQIAQFSDRQLSSDWIRKRFRWTKTTADRLRYMERISQCIVWFLYQHSNVYYLLWNFVKYTHKRWYSHLETTKWIFNNSPFISIWVGLNVDEMFTLIKPPFFDHNTFSDWTHTFCLYKCKDGMRKKFATQTEIVTFAIKAKQTGNLWNEWALSAETLQIHSDW